MSRANMATILARLRVIINDSGSSRMFSDDELQDILDGRAQKFDQVELLEIPTVNATTLDYEYLTYMARVGCWESSPVIQDADFNTLTPSSSDLIAGRWTLSASEDPPCYITGTAYDLYGSAADAMEMWAARLLQGYDAIDIKYTPPKFRVADVYMRLAARFREAQWPNILRVRQE